MGIKETQNISSSFIYELIKVWLNDCFLPKRHILLSRSFLYEDWTATNKCDHLTPPKNVGNNSRCGFGGCSTYLVGTFSLRGEILRSSKTCVIYRYWNWLHQFTNNWLPRFKIFPLPDIRLIFGSSLLFAYFSWYLDDTKWWRMDPLPYQPYICMKWNTVMGPILLWANTIYTGIFQRLFPIFFCGALRI